ncbi:MAG: DUF3052 domain-containing protein [Acidimicrobiales bacterium]
MPKKLGIKEGMDVAVLHGPSDFAATLGTLPDGVTVRTGLRGGQQVDMIIGFVTERRHLAANFPRLAGQLPAIGVFWVAWPKKASKVETDMSDDAIREIVLPSGWVDVKVCEIDAQWSGLKVVLRKELRVSKR